MAFRQDVYDNMQGIVRQKEAYDYLNKLMESATDEKTKNSYAAQMKEVSKQADALRANLSALGVGEYAEGFKNKGLADSKNLVTDYAVASGLQPVRPMVEQTLKQFGENNIDFQFDPSSQTVSVNGINMGKSAHYDENGYNYYTQQQVDDFINNVYLPTTGATKSRDLLYNQNNQATYDKSQQAWADRTDGINRYYEMLQSDREFTKNTNPHDTEWGKSIMADYQWQGNKASGNETASGAASNSGNIDSFSAANAARQQAAFTNMGNRAVNEAFALRLNDLNTKLQNYGIQTLNQQASDRASMAQDMAFSDQLFNHKQTELNSEAQRRSLGVQDDIALMGTTGQVLPQYSNNPYIGAQWDLQARINELMVDPEKNAYEINLLKEARAHKIRNSTDPSIQALPYDSYTPTIQDTAPVAMQKGQWANAVDLAAINGAVSQNVAETKALGDANVANINAQSKMDVAEFQANSKAGSGGSSKNSGSGGSGSSGGDSGDIELSSTFLTQRANYFNKWAKNNGYGDIVTRTAEGGYRANKAAWETIANSVLNDDTLSKEEGISYLRRYLGIPDSVIETANRERKRHKNPMSPLTVYSEDE